MFSNEQWNNYQKNYSQLQVELEPENVCLSVPNFGVAYLVVLSYSNLDICVFLIFEDFSRG